MCKITLLYGKLGNMVELWNFVGLNFAPKIILDNDTWTFLESFLIFAV